MARKKKVDVAIVIGKMPKKKKNSNTKNNPRKKKDKYGPKAEKKIKEVMREFDRGELESGSGKKVKSRDQALAIGISEARDRGFKVPKRKKRNKS